MLQVTLGLNVPWLGESIDYINGMEDPFLEKLWFAEFNSSAGECVDYCIQCKSLPLQAMIPKPSIYYCLVLEGRGCMSVFLSLNNSCWRKKVKNIKRQESCIDLVVRMNQRNPCFCLTGPLWKTF